MSVSSVDLDEKSVQVDEGDLSLEDDQMEASTSASNLHSATK